MTKVQTATPATTITSAVAQARFVTVAFGDGKTFSADNTLPDFKKLKLALKKSRGHLARKYVDAAEALKVWSEGKLKIDSSDNVTYDNHTIHPKMVGRVLRMVHEGTSVTTLIKFLDNLYQNPIAESISDLYEFLEANDLPITEDGCFMAYKRVNNDYRDVHSNTYDNSVGQKPHMPRGQCQLDRNNECGNGFHFGGKNYPFSGSHDMLIKINPANVTNIPGRYWQGGQTKGRCWTYEVIAEVQGGKEKHSFPKAAVHTHKVQKDHGAPITRKKRVRKPKIAVPGAAARPKTTAKHAAAPKQKVAKSAEKKTARKG